MPKKGDKIIFTRNLNYETTKGRRRFRAGEIYDDLSAADLKPLGKPASDDNPNGAYRVATMQEVAALTPAVPVRAEKLASLGGAKHGIFDANNKRIEIADNAKLAAARVKELNEQYGETDAEKED